MNSTKTRDTYYYIIHTVKAIPINLVESVFKCLPMRILINIFVQL